MSSPEFFAPERFETEELVLRAYQPEDASAVCDAINSSFEHLRPWMLWAKPDQTVEEAKALCRLLRAKYLLDEDYTVGIWSGDQWVGSTGFHLRHGGRQSLNAEIGMWIRQSAAGNGLGTRALTAMLEWGFTEWGWERLVWRCDTRNIASRRVAQKCGMVHEGVLRKESRDPDGVRRDNDLFSMLREEWLARQLPPS